MNLIKGGGACLTQEKVVAASARVFLVIADASKQSDELCTKWKLGVPIEVIPMSYLPIKLQIERRYGGVADVSILTSYVQVIQFRFTCSYRFSFKLVLDEAV